MVAAFEMVRENYKRCVEGGSPKPHLFARKVAEAVGLVDKSGRFYRRDDGFPRLNKDRTATVADFPIALLAEAMIGREWKEALSGQSGRLLSEEAVAPIGPSFLANVNAWTATVGGLIQAATLEGYETAEYDLADLFPTRPVTFWQGGERLAAYVGPSEPAPEVGPGESHPDAKIGALWVEPGPMKKYGNKLTVARETAVVDIQGGLLIQAARNLGDQLRFRENELSLAAVVGTTNNFKMGLTQDAAATGYNTYGATVPTGNGTTGTLANDLVNPFNDPFSTMQYSDDSLTTYVHPVSGLTMPMATRLNTVLLPTTLTAFAQFLNGTGQLTFGANPTANAAAPSLGGAFPTVQMANTNPWANRFQVRVSQWLYDIHRRSATPANPAIPPGLGLSAANARRWYRLDPARFAARRVAWEPTPVDLPQNSFTMADQGLVFGQVTDMAVQVQVLSPWAIQRNKAS